MNNYLDKYRKIVDELIKEHFPRLKGKIIIIAEKKIWNLRYSATTTYLVFFSWIAIHPKMRNYLNDGVKAILVHELSHLDIIAEKNLFEKIKFGFSWLFTKKGKFNFERDADKRTIEKGYAKGLIKGIRVAAKTYDKNWLKERVKRGRDKAGF